MTLKEFIETQKAVFSIVENPTVTPFFLLNDANFVITSAYKSLWNKFIFTGQKSVVTFLKGGILNARPFENYICLADIALTPFEFKNVLYQYTFYNTEQHILASDDFKFYTKNNLDTYQIGTRDIERFYLVEFATKYSMKVDLNFTIVK